MVKSIQNWMMDGMWLLEPCKNDNTEKLSHIQKTGRK